MSMTCFVKEYTEVAPRKYPKGDDRGCEDYTDRWSRGGIVSGATGSTRVSKDWNNGL